MRRTPVYIVCSPRPRVGKTLIARLLVEFLLLERGAVAAFDVNLSEPSLVDYLPSLTETANISDTRGQMALMDRLILNDGIAKVLDLGYPAFEAFFAMIEEIGYMKEAERRGIEPIVLFAADIDHASPRAFAELRARFPGTSIAPIDNQHVTFGDLPEIYMRAMPLRIAALPAFLKSIIDRTNFSFAGYLRGPNDESSELHQWIRKNFLVFREIELNLILRKLQSALR